MIINRECHNKIDAIKKHYAVDTKNDKIFTRKEWYLKSCNVDVLSICWKFYWVIRSTKIYPMINFRSCFWMGGQLLQWNHSHNKWESPTSIRTQLGKIKTRFTNQWEDRICNNWPITGQESSSRLSWILGWQCPTQLCLTMRTDQMFNLEVSHSLRQVKNTLTNQGCK